MAIEGVAHQDTSIVAVEEVDQTTVGQNEREFGLEVTPTMAAVTVANLNLETSTPKLQTVNSTV
jgi:hypothetical protein